jgi:hypothetical protein
MALMADRVRETTTTAGTGTVTLDGAATGYQSFGTAFGSGALVYYVIAGPVEWEIGIGTTGAGTLARTTVLQSTNGDALVPFSAGQKDVFCAYVADRAVTTSDEAELTNKTIDSFSNFVGADHLHYKIKANAAITKGQTLKAVGYNAGELAIEVVPVSSASDIAVGIAHDTLTIGQFGMSINTGLLTNVKTNYAGWALGDTLYPDPATGGLTKTKPTSGLYQACAQVARVQAVNGVLLCEFTEPQQVQASTNTANTAVLRDGSGNFAAGTITAAAQVVTGDAQVNGMAKLYGPNGSTILNLRDSSGTVDAREWSFRIVSGTLEIRSVTDANATQATVVSFARAGNITVPNSIFVSGNSTVTGDLTVDTSTLKVDSANNRVGIGTATPATTLDVNGATTLRGNVSFLADATHDIGASASARPRTVYAATSVIAPVMTENGLAVVSQADVGASANELPLNQTLGTMAFQDAASITVGQVQRSYVVRATNTAAQDLRNTFASQVGIDADTTLTSAVPLAGTEGTVVIVTVGATSRTVTFGTGFASTGTLATGTAADRRFVVRFISDGTRLLEVSRTTAITV